MRTQEQGMLTPGDLLAIFGCQTELLAMAHGGDAPKSAECADCDRLAAVIALWANAHMVTADEMAELEAAEKAVQDA